MQPFEVLEVVLLDLGDLVVLQIEQGGVIWDVLGNLLQTCGGGQKKIFQTRE